MFLNNFDSINTQIQFVIIYFRIKSSCVTFLCSLLSISVIFMWSDQRLIYIHRSTSLKPYFPPCAFKKYMWERFIFLFRDLFKQSHITSVLWDWTSCCNNVGCTSGCCQPGFSLPLSVNMKRSAFLYEFCHIPAQYVRLSHLSTSYSKQRGDSVTPEWPPTATIAATSQLARLAVQVVVTLAVSAQTGSLEVQPGWGLDS